MTKEEYQAIRKMYPRVPEDDIKRFILVCQKTELDPLCGEIHLIPMKGEIHLNPMKGKFTIQTGIDGYRKIAARCEGFGGIPDSQWCGEDGVWKDAWLESAPPAACRVRVSRVTGASGATALTSHVALWSEYGSDSMMWRKMPARMLEKCAEAGALRKAFPGEFKGVYTREEMDQANDDARAMPPESGDPPKHESKPETASSAPSAKTVLAFRKASLDRLSQAAERNPESIMAIVEHFPKVFAEVMTQHAATEGSAVGVAKIAEACGIAPEGFADFLKKGGS